MEHTDFVSFNDKTLPYPIFSKNWIATNKTDLNIKEYNNVELAKQDIEARSLITHRFMQDELMEGLSLMKQHEEPYCKVMTLWNR